VPLPAYVRHRPPLVRQEWTPLQGVSYYRLRQTNFDGTSSWTDAVSVFIGGSDNITIFPNPAHDFISVVFSGDVDETTSTLELTDVLGNSVMRESIRLTENNRMKILNTSDLSRGIYLIHVKSSAGTSLAQKIIIN